MMNTTFYWLYCMLVGAISGMAAFSGSPVILAMIAPVSFMAGYHRVLAWKEVRQ